MKKTLSIFLSILIILCSCTGFAASALANNFSSEIDIQKALDKNKYDSSTPLTVTVEGTYVLSSRLVIYSNTTFNCEGATFIKNYQNSTMLAIGQNQDAPYGRDFYKNITINGGTFDANKNNGSILLGHGATLLKNVLLWVLAVWHLWVVRTESWHGLKGWRTASCCAIFSLAVPLYSAVWLPPVDFLPFGRGAALSAVPGFGVYDGRYEEVTDSLMEVSGSKPLVAVVSRRELTVDDLRKLSGLRAEAGAGRISFCLWTLPGQNGGADMDVFYTDEVTLKSLLRAGAGLVVVDGGIVRAKRNLSVFRPVRFGRNVTVGEMMEEDAGLPWRYGVCVLAGLAVMVWVRRKETEGGR